MTTNEVHLLMQNMGIQALKITSKGNEIQALCPFHQETVRSFGVSVDKGLYNCFSCKASGTLLTMVARLKSVSLDRAKQILENYGVYDDIFERRKYKSLFGAEQIYNTSIVEVSKSMYAPYITKRRLLVAYEYLSGRGIKYKKSHTRTSTGHVLGFMPKVNRVLFPWIEDEMFFGCVGRYILKKRHVPRYAPYFGLQKSNHLFLGHTNTERLKTVVAYVIVEGEIDAIRVSQLFPYTGMIGVAMGYSNISAVQLKKLLEFDGAFIIGFDNDKGGRAGVEVARKRLYYAKRSAISVTWPCKDPGACSDKQIADTLRATGNWLYAHAGKSPYVKSRKEATRSGANWLGI